MFRAARIRNPSTIYGRFAVWTLKAFAVDSEISSFDHDVFLELFKVK